MLSGIWRKGCWVRKPKCWCFCVRALLFVSTSDPTCFKLDWTQKVDLPEIKGNHRKFRNIVTSFIGNSVCLHFSSRSMFGVVCNFLQPHSTISTDYFVFSSQKKKLNNFFHAFFSLLAIRTFSFFSSFIDSETNCFQCVDVSFICAQLFFGFLVPQTEDKAVRLELLVVLSFRTLLCSFCSSFSCVV